jgi:DNA-binding response OmpR family regulator
MAKLLLVEDDKGLSEMIAEWLDRDHHIVEVVHDGEEGLSRLFCSDYDVAILDWDLPAMSGVEVCKKYRQEGGKASIIMLTGKTKIDEKEAGFEAGADDYLTKPFSMRELSVRVKALLRRSRDMGSDLLQVGDLVLDPAKFRLTKNGVDVSLVPREFALLEFFMRHPDETFSADALLSRVWISESEASCEAVRTAIMRLRRKIDSPGEESMIESIARVGYRLKSNGR